MAFSDNIIKNMANEIMRNCQTEGVSTEYDFVVYILQLMLYNPRFGASDLDRSHLEAFVDECVKMIVSADTPMYTLKMQYTVDKNYGVLAKLVDEHTDSIEQCLKPLINEILEAYPETEAEYMKLYRKISIFVVLASGLGNPGAVVTLKEGMAALESVFPTADLRTFLDIPRPERLAQLRELVELVSGVRLFNRDCGKGGEGIPDLTSDTLDAGAACHAALMSALVSVTQRVNSLTAARDVIAIDAETGEVVMKNNGMNRDYTSIFDLLIFYRQYEVYIRKLMSDVASISDSTALSVDRIRAVLQEIHLAVKYKTAVPAATVFPLFKKLWSIWRTLQNITYLLATIHRLMSSLSAIQDHVKIPHHVLDEILQRKRPAEQEKVPAKYSNYEKDLATENVQFLGFCALCLNVGALIPSDRGAGVVRCDGASYGFCSVDMAKRFSLEPRRYINEVLNYARNNIHIINLLHLKDDLDRVKGIHDLVAKVEPKIQVMDRHIQTDTHPRASYIDKEYSWDMWLWKRRACQWANIVNCRTRATQTHLSHMRSDAPSQTVEPRERGVQTNSDAAVNTDRCVTGQKKVLEVKPFQVCPCTVLDDDFDNRTYEIIKKANEGLN